jgi:hypothetical protein
MRAYTQTFPFPKEQSFLAAPCLSHLNLGIPSRAPILRRARSRSRRERMRRGCAHLGNTQKNPPPNAQEVGRDKTDCEEGQHPRSPPDRRWLPHQTTNRKPARGAHRSDGPPSQPISVSPGWTGRDQPKYPEPVITQVRIPARPFISLCLRQTPVDLPWCVALGPGLGCLPLFGWIAVIDVQVSYSQSVSQSFPPQTQDPERPCHDVV